MGNPWEHLNPKDVFRVKSASVLTAVDQKNLTYLYQPLLGVTAFSLYLTLWTEIDEDKYWSQDLLHSELLMLLNCGLPELYQARLKLEGIGLLRTYLAGEVYLYELQNPLSSEAFFNEELLSLALFEAVGENKYRRILQRFVTEKVDLAAYQEITKSFVDVYQFSTKKIEKRMLQPNEQILPEKQYRAPEIDDKAFDKAFFYEGLSRAYVSRESITKEIEDLILVLHEMYGIDELQMQKFVAQATMVESGMVDSRKLKQIVHQYYHQQEEKPVTLTDYVGADIDRATNKQLFKKNERRHQGFSDEDIAVIESSEFFSPFNFIHSIKEQKNGHVSKTDTWVLESLVRDSKLSNPVINILIHYLLVLRGDSNLKQGLADSIANDWSQDGVDTPEKAMKKVQALYADVARKKSEQEEKAKSRGTSRNYNNRNAYQATSTRKESLPEWAQDDYQPQEEKKLTDDERKAFMEQLKQKHQNESEGGA